MSREEFRDLINRHREAGTCYLCGQRVDEGSAVHGLTGAHWDCHAKQEKDFDTACLEFAERLRRAKRLVDQLK